LKDQEFEKDVEKAIVNGCRKMDRKIEDECEENMEKRRKCGTCALFVIIRSKWK